VRAIRITFVGFLLYTITLLFASPQLSIKLQMDYDSNVFNLSKADTEKFNSGQGLDFIETSDDFTQKINLRLSDTYPIDQVTLSPYIDGSYTNYLNNTDKNSLNLMAGATTRYDAFSLNTAFGYNPKIYIRDYTNGIYEYQKMMVRLSANYRFHKLAIPLVYYKFEQYKSTNKYFKEYDAPAHTLGAGWRFLTPLINADIMYYYSDYAPSSDDDEIANIIENEKDGSYKSNVYELRLRSKRFYHTALDCRVYTSFRYEDRYFQSVIHTDTYHITRNDKTTTISAGVDMYLARNWDLNLDYKYRTRSVDSDFSSVINAKEYDRHHISTTLHYHIKIF